MVELVFNAISPGFTHNFCIKFRNSLTQMKMLRRIIDWKSSEKSKENVCAAVYFIKVTL